MKPELRAKREAEMRLRNSHLNAQRLARTLHNQPRDIQARRMREYWERVYADKRLFETS